MANTIITKNSATATAVPTAGQLVQGELAVNVTDKRLFTENSGGTVVELGTNPSQVNFADNAKAIFGAGSDLQIYHDGSNSYISDQGTGDMYLLGQSQIRLMNSAGSETYAIFNADGAVQLRYDNITKFDTTATGIDVTGTVVADGLTVDGGALVDINVETETAALTLKGSSFGDGEQITLDFTRGSVVLGQLSVEADGAGTAGIVRLGTASGSVNYDRLMIADNGDISFYEDTGTTPKFFWDASAESLGIGTSSPTDKLHVSGESFPNIKIETNSASSGDSTLDLVGYRTTNSPVGYLKFWNNATSPTELARVTSYREGADNTGNLLFYTSSAGSLGERMRIDSSGNVGIGASSPSQLLEVRGAAARIRITDSDTSGTTGIEFVDSANTVDAEIEVGNSTQYFAIKTAGSERVRIDADGLKFNGDTASTNALDDYEEGTWNPTYEPASGAFTSITYDIQTGHYTKVGRLVTCTFLVRTDAITVGTASGAIKIGDLPFTSISSAARILSISYAANYAGETPAAGYASGAGNNMTLNYRTTVDGSFNNSLQVSDLGTGANANYMIGSIILYAD